MNITIIVKKFSKCEKDFKHLFFSSIMINGILIIKLLLRKRFGQIFLLMEKTRTILKILLMVNLQGEKASIRDSEYTVLNILDLWPYNLPAKKLS